AGPRRELPNDGRQRLVAGVVAFAVFIAAGAFAWRAFGTTTTTGTEPTPSSDVVSVVLDLSSNDGNPAATLSSGDGAQHGVRETYEWCGSDGNCVGGTADFSFYPPVSEYLLVPEGTPVTLTGDGNIGHLATLLPNGEKAPTHVLALTSEPVTPSTPGRYVWTLDAKWDDGSAHYFFGIEVAPREDQVPDVLHLTCTPNNATLDSGTVRAESDGIHIAVDASADVSGADIVTGSNAEDFAGVGLDPQEDGSRGIAIAPGSWSVGCYAGARGGIVPSDIGTPRVAAFTVVDPDGLYAEPVIGCDSTTTTTIDVTGSVPGSDQTWETMIADTAAAIPGLLPTDTVRDAGYPDGPGFKDGPHPVVVRDGSVIATLQFQELAASGGAWSVDLESCAGSGLGEGVVSGPTAAPAPDVAVVRCTDGVAEVETPTVRPQPDGVHILVEAPGSGDELGVIFESTIDRSAYLSGSQDPRNGIVREMGAGTWRVACYSGPGEPNGVAGDAPSLEVVDPDGIWIPTTLQCTGQESGISLTQEFSASAKDAIHAVTGVLPTDVVEPAGYPEGSSAVLVWRVVRDGSVVAWLHLRQAGDEWSVIAGMGCTDAGIGVPHSMPTPA
ncbi:MAG: hypothetical protein M3P10_08270, partial [Actinomycetota bacterium]|nr:hypothetical protein [Actinomycetota bacterium]